MSSASPASSAPPAAASASAAAPGVITVVGIGADGWDGLTREAKAALSEAEVLIGGRRQLALLPPECGGEQVGWPSPLRPAVRGLFAEYAGRRIAVPASGDPSFYGIARTLSEELGPEQLRVLPHPSSVSFACARLGWPLEDVEVVTLVGRPAARLAAVLHERRRLLVLSAGAATPREVAGLLEDRGFGPSRMRVLEQLGGEAERVGPAVPAEQWPGPYAAKAGGASTPGDEAQARDDAQAEHEAQARDAVDALNIVAVECRRAPGSLRLGAVPGLPDDAYEHDGQLTKRHVRAATLAALAPAPGELLWDVGAGSGSVAVEWMRTHPSCGAVAVERDPGRAARIERNADRLGVPGLRVVTGAAPECLSELPTPDAVFIGGGLTAPGLLEACWERLPAGGRLVANTVTLESGAVLAEWHKRLGGELVRLAVSHAAPVGGFTGWRQAMPVTQWVVVKSPAPPDD